VSLAPVLSLRGFGVAFADRTVLAEVTLDLPRRGMTILVGPAGAGKSTLLRTLAGLNDAHPALSTWGSAVLDGRPIESIRPAAPGQLRPGVGMVVQHARFFLSSIRENLVSALPNRAELTPAAQTRLVTEVLERNGLENLVRRLEEDVASQPTSVQRRLALVRALVPDPLVILADEPTAGLDDQGALDLLALLRAQALLRAVLFVTHNQRFARAAGGTVALLASGRIEETSPADTFFDAATTPAGRSFVRTGRCADISPDATAEVLDEAAVRPPPLPAAARVARSRFVGPRGFFWVQPGLLGGVPRPGVVDAVDSDLEGLRRLGISVLVTLEETLTVDPAALARHGIASRHFPIADMGAPAHETAVQLCGEVARLTAGGAAVAVHCRAGLGRTGTVLAAQLVFEGEPAAGAIERIRGVNPRCIQSQLQVEFLSTFEAYMARPRVTALRRPSHSQSQSEQQQERNSNGT
jgi:atypical dual specificity phosphatase